MLSHLWVELSRTKNDIPCNEVMSPEKKEKQTKEPTQYSLKFEKVYLFGVTDNRGCD